MKNVLKPLLILSLIVGALLLIPKPKGNVPSLRDSRKFKTVTIGHRLVQENAKVPESVILPKKHIDLLAVSIEKDTFSLRGTFKGENGFGKIVTQNYDLRVVFTDSLKYEIENFNIY